MRTGQVLFLLEIEPGISTVRLWKQLIAIGAQTTWFEIISFRDLLFPPCGFPHAPYFFSKLPSVHSGLYNPE